MDPRLLRAARFGKVDALRRIAQEDKNLLLGVTPFRNTALHIAVGFNRQKFAEEIYAKKPALLLERNANEETPLHTAAIVGSFKAIVFFLGRAAAADVEHGTMQALLWAVDRDGNNALHAALLNGPARVAEMLVSADPGLAVSINKKKESPLYLAATRGFLDILLLLLQCDTCVHGGPRGQTALHAAVIGGHRKIARALLERKTGISKEQDDEGKTPLHHAVTWGDLKMVRLLLEHDSSVAYIADSNGCSPVHLSAKGGHVAVFFKLFRNCPDAVDAVDAEGRNALHIAIEHSNHTLALDLLRFRWFNRLLNQRDNKGKTPLHIAVEKYNPLILQQLLEFKRVNSCITDQRGLTAAQSFLTDENPHLELSWYVSHSIVSEAWAKDDAYKKKFVKNNVHRMENKLRQNILETYSQKISIVAALMATVTFAAAFMMPGGYVSEDGLEKGLAVLSRKAALKVFLISDTISMCCSLLTAYLYSTSNVTEIAHLWVYTKFGGMLVLLAFLGMIIAFATGIYVVVTPTCLWLGILVCFLCCSVPFLVVVVNRLGVCLPRKFINIFRILFKSDLIETFRNIIYI